MSIPDAESVDGRDLPKNGAQAVDLPRVEVGEEFGIQLGGGLQGTAGEQAAAGRELEVLAVAVAGVTHAPYRVEFFQIVGHVNDDARGNPQGPGEASWDNGPAWSRSSTPTFRYLLTQTPFVTGRSRTLPQSLTHST